MDWLTNLTNWLREQLLWLWNGLVSLLGDMVVKVFSGLADFAATIIEAIPVPDFLSHYSLAALLGSTGPTVGWIFSTLRMPEAFGIIGAGYAFRLLRKLLTLGQW